MKLYSLLLFVWVIMILFIFYFTSSIDYVASCFAITANLIGTFLMFFALSAANMLSNSRKGYIALLMVCIFAVLAVETVSFAISYNAVGLTTNNNEQITLPLALYFSIVTWTTLGYGDITPVRGLGRFLASSEALFGYINMAVLIAILGKAVENGASQGNEPKSDEM